MWFTQSWITFKQCQLLTYYIAKYTLQGAVNKFPDWIFRALTEQLVVLFPRYHGLVCWKPAFWAHSVWCNSSFYQEVQHSLCDYRDGGFPWTACLHQILFQVRENCYRMLWNVEDSFWGTSYGSFPNISVVFPVQGRQNFDWWWRTLWSTSVQFNARNDWESASDYPRGPSSYHWWSQYASGN